MAQPLREAATGLLGVKVRPRSKKPGVERLGEGEFLVRVRSAPEKGRANREVLDRLADYLGVPVSRLKIVRGEATSRKIVRRE